MQLRNLSPGDAAQVRAVWKKSFDDSDAFLDTYFESAADINDGRGFFNDTGKLLSNLFVLNVDAQIEGMVYPSQFIAGCATLPEARNQHLMRNLFTSVLSEMSDSGVCAVYLHPFLHSFYRNFGFETVSYVQRFEQDPAQSPDPNVHIATAASQVPSTALRASYMDYVSGFDNYFMRTQKRMDTWLSLLFADENGKAAFIEAQNNTPYCLYYETSDEGVPVADVFELVYFNDHQKNDLLSSLGMTARYFLPAHAGDRDVAQYTMMRVLRPDIMLQSYQYPAGMKPFVINIHDAFMGRDYNFQVIPGPQGATTEITGAESDIVVDINSLAQLLTGAFKKEDYPAAAGIFTSGSSCYFETY